VSAAPAFAPSTVSPPRVTELHLRTVLEQLPVALMRLDAAGTLLAVNDAGLALLGADSLDVVLGTSFLSCVTDEDARPLCVAFLHDAAHGLRASRELTLRGFNGELHVVEVQAVPYPGAADQARGRAAPPARRRRRHAARGRDRPDSHRTRDSGRCGGPGGRGPLGVVTLTGLLLESPQRFAPGQWVTVHFDGALTTRHLRARIVRCQVSLITAKSTLRYQTAMAFDGRLALPRENPDLGWAAPAPDGAEPAAEPPAPHAANRW
jgi:hypothetical protein